MRKLQRGEL